jgi:hypothetical protein
MGKEKTTDESKGVSRRKMLEGAAAAAAVVSAGLLAGCNENNKAEKLETTQAPASVRSAGAPSPDPTGALAVWLALILNSWLKDLGTLHIDPWGTTPPDTKTLSQDMGVPQSNIDDLVKLLKTTNPPRPVPLNPPPTGLFFYDRKGLYDYVRQDLDTLGAAIYSGTDCPHFYATLKSIARM